ncbi:hypothetical protein N7541_006116 [Penicillium brevicompactum]|uniref:NACHT domain-containing protein n=1 Tax=Penicillium brevicompactum TaxID=5074 RepID=A0A9W9R4F7_PENBR|nr:hypothetical protein N7541_006116 [Penicillium brevicompactum]
MKKLCKECDFTRAWVTLVAESAQRPKWKTALPPKRKGMLSRLRRSKEAQPQLKSIFGATQTRDSRQESHGDSPLLQNAMQTCGDAQLFYADAIIAQYYTEGKLLHVRRISGDDVPIENCYIDLSLIEDLAERDTKINQTTLCKKITHAFLRHGLWRSKYDRIIWIPLRNLKNYQTFELFIEQEVFGKIPYSKPLWERLKNKLCDFQDCRSLFILDGLDEIAGLPEKIDLFQYLLNRQDVIITSRPHVVFPSKLKGYDLEIETVGFLDDQIEHYVDRVCSKADGLQIKNFIEGHWMMQGLMRIPIQLDALCFAWEEGIQRVRPLTTMTALYQAIEIKLWKKDIPRLDPSVEHKVVKCHNRPQLALQIPDVIEFIQYIAFFGLYNNITEFDLSRREEIYQKFPEMSDRVLDEVSFLRSSDASSSPRDQDYYFLHLTFQEYFAARHVLQSWKERKDIPTLDLHSGDSISISADDFIGREKYNGQYNIMWRFVVGSMSSKDLDLVRLFKQIEAKPRDLLKPVHIRFLVHCFSEVDEIEERPDLADLRRSMERHLVQLMNGDYFVDFLREMEVPERPFLQALEESEPTQQKPALAAIKSRSHIGDKLSRQIWTVFQSDAPSSIRAQAAALIGRFRNFSSNEVLSAMFDPNDDIFNNVMQTLTDRNHISETILSAAVDLLPRFRRLDNVRDRFFARRLPQATVNKLVARYHQTSNNTDKSQILRILDSKECLNIPDIHRIFVQAFQDPDRNLRSIAFRIFVYNRGDLPIPDCQKLLSKMPSEPIRQSKVRMAYILNNQGIMPKGYLDHLWRSFETGLSGESATRDLAFEMLRDASLWSFDELAMRFDQSIHKDIFAISVTGLTFGHHLDLPGVILSHCVGILERTLSDEISSVDEELSEDAIVSLMRCYSLSFDVIQIVWQLLKAGKVSFRAYQLLKDQDCLPDRILRDMNSYLEEQDLTETHFLTLAVLGPRVTLSDSLIESAVFALLQNPGDEDWTQGLEGLLFQPGLPSWALERLAVLLISTHLIVADNAKRILRKHADFEEMLPRLDVEHWTEIFQGLLVESYEDANILCYIQGGYFHVVLPERSWKVGIEQLEQRHKLQSALGLDDIYQTERFAQTI